MRGAHLFLACIALCSAGALPAQPASNDGGLRAYLQARFRADRVEDRDARYVVARADLNGDGRPEALVYLLSSAYCGTGGCNLLILTPAGRSWRKVAEMTIVNPPVRLLSSVSHGWRDLAVRLTGGGTRAHEALLAFNGRTYPGNPSMPPARAMRRHMPGRVLIADGDRGQPLF